jgi:hypothetical protein
VLTFMLIHWGEMLLSMLMSKIHPNSTAVPAQVMISASTRIDSNLLSGFPF